MKLAPRHASSLAEALQLIALPGCACDAEGRVVAANAALRQLLGADPTGCEVPDLFGGATRASAQVQLRMVLAGAAASQRWDATLDAVPGGLAVQVWCLALPAGAGGGATLVFNDVSAHQRDQLTLRKRLLEQQAILENAAVGIVLTKAGVIQDCNQRAAEMLGYAVPELAGRAVVMLHEDSAAYHALHQQADPLLARGKAFVGERQLRSKDGSLFWCRLHARAVDRLNAFDGTVWILEDISLIRQTQMEVEAIMTNASVSIVFTKKRTILRYNRGFAEMFGYPDYAGQMMPGTMLYPSRAAYEALGAAAMPLLQAGKHFQTETLLRRSDGSTLWAQMIGYCVNPDDPAQGTIWIIEDRSEHQRAEATLRQALHALQATRDELEARVLERTAELAGANALLQAEIVERRQAEARVHHMAYHDSLTGLPNRALLTDRLERSLLVAQRSKKSLAVMFLDLDRFKAINDTLGHETGDHLLREVATRLSRAMRASDSVARLGGDEFVVLVPGMRSTEDASLVAEKIIAALAVPIPFQGHMLHITPSIGISVYPGDGDDVATMMRHADAAMYHAKESGRNNYQYFKPSMNLAAALLFELENSLRGALEDRQFELFYQPIIDVATRRLASMEVLLRWNRPGQGMALPDQFIPILEENGLIVPVGEWVLRAACEQSMAWRALGLRQVPMAINLSARQFMHAGLLDTMRNVLDDTGIDPALLEFEITETALMGHGAQTLQRMGQIQAMGVRLSIDDFGTGYSSLAYLKRFPVSKLKIDRAFIKDLEDSSEDRAIVGAVIALSDSLQLSIVAEGVETEGQFALLRQSGCEYAQGYLFSQPLPEQHAVHWLERSATRALAR